MRVAFPKICDGGLVKKTLHWITTPEKFSSVTVRVIVLLLTTPIVEVAMKPSLNGAERSCCQFRSI